MTLLHVVDHVRSPNTPDLEATEGEREDKLIPSELRQSLKVKPTVGIGKACEQIVQYTLEDESDLIVKAARVAEALDRAVFGSTTYGVIQLGSCPVLAVHA